ncbi:helix-turn-helix domain-containing protein [Weissella paramesenteroides]|uniref:helix-turn-helix domain-containing protein n=1 Tax=Weissella paramesenteroides TaxID=1249 RepID=UPI003857DDA5
MNTEHFIETRKRLSLSQEELAQGICTQATLSRFESGGSIPSVKILTQLCHRLGLSIAVLFRTQADSRGEFINDTLNQAEFDLIISEYDHANQKLDELELTEEENEQFGERLDYIRGYLAILLGHHVQENIDGFHAKLLDSQTEIDIYTLLNYCGLGMGYAYLGKDQLAEKYFNFVFIHVFDFQSTSAGETWKILTILFYTAEFYSSSNLAISNRILETIVSMCSDNHMTFYLARSVLQLAENEAAGEANKTRLVNYLIDAHAYAKINRNQVELQRIDYLIKKWHLQDLAISSIFDN